MKITQSQRLLKTKERFSRFSRTSKIQGSTRLKVPDLSGNRLQIYVFGSFVKNLQNLLFSLKNFDWRIFFQVSWFEQSHCNAGYSASYKKLRKETCLEGFACE